jgi:hypothetical protein
MAPFGGTVKGIDFSDDTGGKRAGLACHGGTWVGAAFGVVFGRFQTLAV